ncbi:putative dna-directed rna polymerases ii 24 kda polypeptide protein [Phaeoacremonium minimum UCRPA7]|uniref:DNA-directed RNA polymerases I, II, and III subunit RPABC1 n=1 Tax=Phaeoacremonium minimum (strain UCR-PA7) TaxID=1286976 RepID=R8BB95_PHAM7|nr:putative dna-directed rna polymerases ii 24 kda polypeptide protein [Phaeoacremonium minimum UCRPA7]EON96571.1 putative dna-directed rna polymerases ii 24 kda polypeptide protein [Phaeoacremonium minimum UCRPA7]
MDEEGNSNRDANARETLKFWRSWRTVHEMVQDRGYELTEEEVKISLDQFKAEFCTTDGSVIQSKLSFSARPSDAMMKKFTPPPTPANPDPAPECGNIWVEFMSDNSIGVKEIKKFVQHCAGSNFKAGIMVTVGALSPQARKVINATQQYTQIECFIQEDLLVNITHHELVPTHVLLSKEEKIALLKRYRLKETQLPRILQKDPVARYLGLKRGQVVKIIRKSETAGRYASYRLCV